jgi:Icc-related predicted phosphoesterase
MGAAREVSSITTCLFVSDLHGREDRYEKLLAAIEAERPAAVFLGGDLLPFLHASSPRAGAGGFIGRFLAPRLHRLRRRLGDAYPRIFVILGNDDPRSEEPSVETAEQRGLWLYAHGKRLPWLSWTVYGYAYTPPSPFRLKDWERYDVSRFVDPGCIAPEDGGRSVPVPEGEAKYATIQEDLGRLAGDHDVERSILLFHAPPYRTNLDRAALDGRMVEHAPLDVNIGSIAIRRFIEERQPLLTLHGHVHESASLTGSWSDRIGRTLCLSAAHDGPELALVRFEPEAPGDARRELL